MPLVALADLAVRSMMLLPVRVDILAVLHLLHKDEPFVELSGEYLFDYIDALQKFCIRASSGNPTIYTCNNLDLCDRKFLFLLPISLQHVTPGL